MARRARYKRRERIRAFVRDTVQGIAIVVFVTSAMYAIAMLPQWL